MPEACEIVVYVRSRQVVDDSREIRTVVPLAATLNAPTYVPLRRFVVTYRRGLDADQDEVLERVRRVAIETGNPVRVVDLGRMHPFLRALRFHMLGGRALPIVIMNGTCPRDLLAGVSPARAGVRA